MIVPLALTALAQNAGAMSAHGPTHVLFRNRCVAKDAKSPLRPFRFDLAFDEGKWSNRIVFEATAEAPARELDFADTDVQFVASPTPGEQALANHAELASDSVTYRFWALARVKGLEMTDFSVNLGIGDTWVNTDCTLIDKRFSSESPRQ